MLIQTFSVTVKYIHYSDIHIDLHGIENKNQCKINTLAPLIIGNLKIYY